MSSRDTIVTPESETVSWTSLQVLLKAPSKKYVNSLFMDVFRFRAMQPWPTKLVDNVTANLDVGSDHEAVRLLDVIRFIIRETVFHQLNPTEVLTLFPQGFHQQLGELISAIVTTHLATWKAEARHSQPGLAAFKSVDWRVDSTASGDSSGKSEPKAIVSIEVQPNPTHTDELPGQDTILFEIDKTTLKAMLEGLGRIRDQLNSISQQ